MILILFFIGNGLGHGKYMADKDWLNNPPNADEDLKQLAFIVCELKF